MASILAENTFQATTAAITHNVTLPTVTAGALIVVYFVQGGARTLSSITSNWDNRGIWALDPASVLSTAYLFTKKSDGTETTLAVTFNLSITATAHCYVIDCDYFSFQAATSNGLSNTINPAQATTTAYKVSDGSSSTWVSGTSTFFLAIGAGDSRNKSTNISGWSVGQSVNASGTAPGVWGFSLTDTTQVDPGTFTLSGTTRWATQTMGFWDAPPSTTNALFWCFP